MKGWYQNWSQLLWTVENRNNEDKKICCHVYQTTDCLELLVSSTQTSEAFPWEKAFELWNHFHWFNIVYVWDIYARSDCILIILFLLFRAAYADMLHDYERVRTDFNTLRLRQDGCHFAGNIFKHIFLNGNIWISINITLKFIHKGRIDNIPVLFKIMAWHRPGDKPLSKPMLVSLLMHICVTQP